MKCAGNKRGIGAASLAVSVIAILIATGSVYYLVTVTGPHSSTGSLTKNTTRQTPIVQTSENLTTIDSTGSIASSDAFSNTTDSTTIETSQTSSTYSPMQVSMVVNQTIVDQAQACYGSVGCREAMYIFNMTVTNTGTQNYSFDDLNLYLRTNGSTLYGTYLLVYAIQFPASGHPDGLPGGNIRPGEKIAGEEGFKIPINEVPRQLIYQDVYAGVNATADIPAPTSWVSEVVTFGAASIAPPDLECGNAGSTEPPCFTATYGGMNSSILGSADYFTGQVMAFNVTIFMTGQGALLGAKVMSSIAAFDLVGYTALECTGGSPTCSQWTFDVYFTAEPGLSYYGTPALTILLTET